MTKGTFTDFMNAMKNLESGVNYEFYQNGSQSAQQIINLVGADAWSEYQNGEISWSELQNHSHNSLGFVGYQVGEPIMIDTGYYRDSAYYMNGAGTNTWDGQFTGKNGIFNMDDLESDLQEAVILDAFGYNLKVITEGLAAKNLTLNDFIGDTMTFSNGASVTLSFTGIVAAAHLCGAWGVLSFLLEGKTPSDEYGTSILKYIDLFGGYDAYDANTLINSFKNGTGIAMAETMWGRDINDDGQVTGIPGAPGGGNGGNGGTTGGTTETAGNGGDGGNSEHTGNGGEGGNAGDTSDTGNGGNGGQTGTETGNGGNGGDAGDANTVSDRTGAEYDITWNWAKHETIQFDSAHDTLDFSTMPTGNYHVWEDGNDVIIEVQGNGGHTYTLEDTSFEELDMSHFVGLDATGRAFWDNLV